MSIGFIVLNYVGQSLRTVTQVKEKMAAFGYAELLEGSPNELENLWHELILLENRIVKQKMNIQVVKLELSGD